MFPPLHCSLAIWNLREKQCVNFRVVSIFEYEKHPNWYKSFLFSFAEIQCVWPIENLEPLNTMWPWSGPFKKSTSIWRSFFSYFIYHLWLQLIFSPPLKAKLNLKLIFHNFLIICVQCTGCLRFCKQTAEQ